jgi:hypothetical protein
MPLVEERYNPPGEHPPRKLMKCNFQTLSLRIRTLSRKKECYECRILQQLQNVGMTHKHISNETLEVIFVVAYLRVVVV